MIARWCAVHLPKQACASCETGDCLELELLRKGDDAGSWITINGAHVHLNAAGEVDKGPKEILRVPMAEDKQRKEAPNKLYHFTSFQGAQGILNTGEIRARGFGNSFTTNPGLNYQGLVGLGGVQVALEFDRPTVATESRLVDYEYKDPFLDTGDEKEVRTQENKITTAGLRGIRVYASYAHELHARLGTFDEYVSRLQASTNVPVTVINKPVF